MSDEILFKQESPHVVSLTLNRPEKRNALNRSMMEALKNTLERLEKDPAVRIVIFKGAGEMFCSGLDLNEAEDPAKAPLLTDAVSQAFKKIYSTSLVTIVLAHGAAIAGGAGFLSACDFAVGSIDLKYGFPEVRRGIVPSIISAMLARQLGWRQLRELFLLGNMISGARAAEMGLLNAAVSEAELTPYGLQLAKEVLKGAPDTIKRTKQLLNRMYSENFEEEMAYALNMHRDSKSNGEALEGIRAFQEKRKPSWEPS